ncbi:neuropeptide-like protein C4orf48 homolog [Mustela nigripes]|uniref:neuropeptide-like protein C4orf48 homolog n=2 Tax=Mustela TaxID=9665 RepID=UPI002814AF30|nr:neuropeptide-like protein C4orf48 homolog [Mustela nigripes]
MTTTADGGPGRGPVGAHARCAADAARLPESPALLSRGPRTAGGPGSQCSAMAPLPLCRLPRSLPPWLLLLLSVALLGFQARAEPAAGNAVPAQSRPCVDCHAFEFMQRALQDLRKTAYSLDSRTEALLLQAERRALCACWPAGR